MPDQTIRSQKNCAYICVHSTTLSA